MDHLSHLVLGRQSPGQSDWPPVMPVFTSRNYDMGGDLFQYPERIGITRLGLVQMLRDDDMSIRYSGHGHLQTWTFFGVISTILGRQIEHVHAERPYGSSIMDDYVRTIQPNGLLRFDTTALRTMVMDWIEKTRAQTKQQSDQQRWQQHNHVVDILSEMTDIWTRSRHGGTGKKYPLDSNLMLSVGLLYEYLNWASRIAYGPWNSDLPIPHGPVFPFGLDRVLEHIKIAGWCPAELRVMSDSFTILELWRLSFLEVPHRGKDHSKCANSAKCSAYQIEESAYETKHDNSSNTKCDCEFVYASQARLAEILLGPAEGIPLVQHSAPQRDPKDNRLYVELVSSREILKSDAVDWIAISHVWSDGLGNNKDNGIPLCQFERLCRLTSALPNSTYTPFWLDTLCFPLKPKEAYNTALIRMKESYESARSVLVLDGYILGAEAGNNKMHFDEMMARITVCPWNRRLWTWQEAFLAKCDHLFFQFKDGAVCDKDILDACEGEWMTDLSGSMDYAMCQGIYARFQDIRSRDEDLPIWDKVAKAKDTLTFRSTSQAPDEALCLSNVIGVDTSLIVNADEKNRMQVFWKNVGGKDDPHASLLFWDGPRLDVEGLRWAPSTFMDASRPSAQHGWHRLDGSVRGLSNLGLHVRLPSIVCTELIITSSDLCYLRVQSRKGWSAEDDLLHFSLDMENYSKVRDFQQVSKGFVVLLPWLWEFDMSWGVDVQVAGISAGRDDALRLLTTGYLSGDVGATSGPRQPNWITSYAAPEAEWHVD